MLLHLCTTMYESNGVSGEAGAKHKFLAVATAEESWSRSTFQVQGMGITLPLLGRRFIVIFGAGKMIWTLDRVEKVLSHQVLSVLTLEDVACHVLQEAV